MQGLAKPKGIPKGLVAPESFQYLVLITKMAKLGAGGLTSKSILPGHDSLRPTEWGGGVLAPSTGRS